MLLIACLTLSAQGARATREQPAKAPPLPDKLQPPKGHVLRFKADAEGVQIYVSKEVEKGKFAWAFKAPLADLLVDGKKVGYHYAGPTWELADGSRVVRDAGEDIAAISAPNPKANIPWLRIKLRTDGKAEGGFDKVTHVLRIRTEGGLAPSQSPARAGTEVGVRYKAVYEFYGPSR
jgi:hypothetical protein